VRRTQAERTAAMRQRLLDATVDCLAAYGYAGTTTLRVAEMAGVTRGAQIHHYPSKEDLVVAAIEHLAHQRARKAISDLGLIEQNPDPANAILDFLWSLNEGPLFERVEPVVNAGVFAAVAQFMPDESARRDLRHATYTAMDAIRGLRISSFADGDDDRLRRRWERARAWLRSDIERALNS